MPTGHKINVITVVITYDSRHTVALCTDERQQECRIQQHEINRAGHMYTIPVKGKWVVMHEVEQNVDGSIMCVPYSDDGALSAIVFNNTGKVLSTIGLNRACGIDEGSKPIVGFFQPMITCCFIQEDLIYFTVHHRVTSMCYNFIYSHATDSVLSRVGETRIKDSTLVNFPNKSFYNSIDNEIYTFYRQGQCITRSS
mgnify:CR=1 FL=1